MPRPMRVAASLAFVLIATLACAVSGVPTSSPDEIGTIVAATMAAVTPQPSATPQPPTPTLQPLILPTNALPTQQPSGPSVVLVPEAARITFLTGATTGVVSAPIQAGQSLSYVLQASQGQPMMVDVGSANGDVTLSMKTQGGTSMLNASEHATSWQGSVPMTEDYYLTVHGGATAENFTMTITIPSRVKFAEGADSAKVSGTTVSGYNSSYTLFAVKDQKMSVELTYLSGEAVLSIFGWNDGQPYVRSAAEKTSFSFTLPATQDYIVQVVPRAGSTVSYQLKIEIK